MGARSKAFKRALHGQYAPVQPAGIKKRNEQLMKTMTLLCTILLLTLGTPVSGAHPGLYADLVLIHGKVWTVDKAQPTAQAVAIRGDRIVAVGSDAEVQALVGPKTRKLDLRGKLLLPGFIDGHAHFISGGFQLLGIDLRPARNEQAFIDRIKAHVRRYPGRWITGGDWDHESWPGARLPHKTLIDSITQDTPVFVSRLDGHMGLANSAALKAAGIDRNTPDPPGGAIVRDPATGEPTGILKDEAMSAVYALVPDASEAEVMEAAHAALELARQCGVTSIQDISSGRDVAIYQKLLNRGELTARIDCRLPIHQLEEHAALGIHAHFGNNMIQIGALKAFADGSLGSSTALFLAPYAGTKDVYGLPMDIVLDGRMQKWCLEADRNGLQLSVHAIGDSANRYMLDVFEKCVRENPRRDRRFRLEHAQHIAAADIPRFAKLGVIASVQPYHTIDDGRWAHKRIGTDRCREAYPFRSFLDQGVKVCFGTDWTVAPMNPLWSIYGAVTRRTLDGLNPDGWIPEEKISVAEAIECYTINCAYATYEETCKGMIKTDYLADLVVLSDDIFTIAPEKIWDVQVDCTILGGKVVYERPATAKMPGR